MLEGWDCWWVWNPCLPTGQEISQFSVPPLGLSDWRHAPLDQNSVFGRHFMTDRVPRCREAQPRSGASSYWYVIPGVHFQISPTDEEGKVLWLLYFQSLLWSRRYFLCCFFPNLESHYFSCWWHIELYFCSIVSSCLDIVTFVEGLVTHCERQQSNKIGYKWCI